MEMAAFRTIILFGAIRVGALLVLLIQADDALDDGIHSSKEGGSGEKEIQGPQRKPEIMKIG